MTTFHVRHDFNPTVARETLLLLRFQDAPNANELLTWAREREMEIGQRKSIDKVLSSLRDLGFVRRAAEVGQRGAIPKGHAVKLTELGQMLASVAIRDRLLFAELVHLRYWWLWTAKFGGEGFAWAYQSTCNMLWQAAPTTINQDLMVASILAEAPQVFDVQAVSFSRASIQGILHWLKALSPPCITAKDQFRRRPSCPPESLVIALEGAKRVAGTSGIPLYLDVSVRECVCRATLLDFSGFDEVLSEAQDMGLVTCLTTNRGEAILIGESLFPGLISVSGGECK